MATTTITTTRAQIEKKYPAMKVTRELQARLGLREEPTAFGDIARAMSWAARCDRGAYVVHGDYDEARDAVVAWVVYRHGDAMRLEKAGYEVPFYINGGLTLHRN